MVSKAPAWFLPKTCSRNDLAAMFGVRPAVVSDLAARGVLVRSTAGKYKTLESMLGYCEHMRNVKTGRVTDDKKDLLQEEKITQAKISRQMAEIELAEKRGEVIRIDELEASWGWFAGQIKSTINSMPGRLRSEFPHLTGHDEKRIRELFREMLIEMSEDVKTSVLGASESGFDEAA